MAAKKSAKKAVKKPVKKAVAKTKIVPKVTDTFKAVFDTLRNKKRWIKNAEALTVPGDGLGDIMVGDEAVSFCSDDHSRYSKNPKRVKGRDKENLLSFCLIGAVHNVNGPNEELVARSLALAILRQDREFDADLGAIFNVLSDIDEVEETITYYNDASHRSHEDVVAVIREAKKLYPSLRRFWSAFDLYYEIGDDNDNEAMFKKVFGNEHANVDRDTALNIVGEHLKAVHNRYLNLANVGSFLDGVSSLMDDSSTWGGYLEWIGNPKVQMMLTDLVAAFKNPTVRKYMSKSA